LQIFNRRATGFTPAVGDGHFVAYIADQRSKTSSQSRMIRHRRS
jgi:hypothetical protein